MNENDEPRKFIDGMDETHPAFNASDDATAAEALRGEQLLELDLQRTRLEGCASLLTANLRHPHPLTIAAAGVCRAAHWLTAPALDERPEQTRLFAITGTVLLAGVLIGIGALAATVAR